MSTHEHGAQSCGLHPGYDFTTARASGRRVGGLGTCQTEHVTAWDLRGKQKKRKVYCIGLSFKGSIFDFSIGTEYRVMFPRNREQVNQSRIYRTYILIFFIYI